MLIGVPKEVKDKEHRVGVTPEMAHLLIESGHRVLIQTHAGDCVGFSDEAYRAVGAEIVSSPKEVYSCEMVIKVKEPQPSEYPLLKREQILFCYLHLSAEPELTKALVESGVIAIAYETITDDAGRLPLLIPMSEIAGRIAIQVGATLLHMNHGGSGLLLGGVPGVKKGSVVVIGGGSAGTEAARLAFGFGAEVTIFDKKLERLRELDLIFHGGVTTLYSTPISLRKALTHADLVVGAVLVPGKRAPRIITREMIASMPKGSVFVDVAIDQGGCSDTSRPTSHTHPTYVEEGVIHYCVTNMPGACSRTATRALTNATMSYALLLANKGYRQALLEHKSLREGLNTYLGKVTHEGVAHDLDYPFTPFHTL